MIKVLFVVADFYQAGAQRFAYEVDKALDKNKYEISILCLAAKNKVDKDWKIHYYENKHKALGTEIEFIDPYLVNPSLTMKERLFHKLTKNKFKKNKNKFNSALDTYLNQFDLIHWMGEYTFIHDISEILKRKSLIYSMCAKFQDPNLYDRFDFNYAFNFVSPFNDGEEIYEYSQFKNISHTYFPLVLEITQKNNQWNFKNCEIKKIGIFTRLSLLKPLDPFFYAFHVLLGQLPNCELHVFGNGNPVDEGMITILERIGIQDKVFFRGHQADIVQTAIDENLDLSWFQGYNNYRPAGYAGFDICTTGLPLLCWDFHPKPFKPYNMIYPHFKNITDFVEKSYEILTNSLEAEKLSQSQFDEVLRNRNVESQIGFLEGIYDSLIFENSKSKMNT